MDRYLSKNCSKASSALLLEDTLDPASSTNMVGATRYGGQQHTAPLVSPADAQGKYSKIAESVAQLLQPTIVAAMEQAFKQGLANIKKELSSHAQQLTEA